MVSPANITNFLNGFQSGVAIRNLPVIVANSGRQIWVDSNGPGHGASKGTFQRPYLTVAQAISNALANDTIWVKSGHTETITTAGGWTPTNSAGSGVTGVKVIGVGVGNERPQITFSTATTASVALNQQGTAILNIIGICGIASLSSPFNVTASDCTVDVEWRDATASTSALRAILTNASAVNCNFNIKYVGISGTSVTANAIRLVGSANNRINVDFFGTANTGVVEFLTTAATNTFITGVMNNSLGSSTHTKEVVDTVTGSHYAAYYLDINSSSTDSGYFFKVA